MKILNEIILVIMLFGYNLSAQELKKGDLILDAYYGFPKTLEIYKFGKEIDFRLEGLPSGGEFGKSTEFPTLGIKGEYLLSDKIGLGLNVFNRHYSIVNIIWTPFSNVESKYTNNTSYIIPTFNYHFINKNHLDVFSTIGLGLSHSKVNIETIDFNGVQKLHSFELLLGVGARYFFTQHVGISTSFQLVSHSSISAGISYKL